MSVCFFVPSEQVGTSAGTEEVETEVTDDSAPAQQTLQQFWTNVMEDINKVTAEDFKTQALPLSRIKKIMKLDEEVKMISAEAPVLFAKAAEIFIHELTLRAWAHTEDNKRRTLQRNDIAMAISKSDQFDFLIDIVPRQEVKHSRPKEESVSRPNAVTEQITQQTTTAIPSAATQPQIVLQPCGQILQGGGATTSAAVNPQPVALLQHCVPHSDHTALPIQLTQAQLNMIRLQVQNNPGQPIIIQAQPQAQQTPQIIQVTSQSPPQQHVYLTQINNTQDES